MSGVIFLSVLIVSLVSLIGVSLIVLTDRRHEEDGTLSATLTFLVALAVGALLANLVIHLLPEAYGELGSSTILYVAGGLVTFFLLEKALHWRHLHQAQTERIEPVGWMNLIADGIHNFIDGALIAAAYLVSLPVGIATSVAVMLHEIPQELGDYGVLRAAGFSRSRALLFNFISAAVAILGAAAVVVWGDAALHNSAYILAIAAGGFIYLIYLLLRKLGEDMHLKRVLLAIVAFTIGLAAVWSIESYAHELDGHDHDHAGETTEERADHGDTDDHGHEE